MLLGSLIVVCWTRDCEVIVSAPPLPGDKLGKLFTHVLLSSSSYFNLFFIATITQYFLLFLQYTVYKIYMKFVRLNNLFKICGICARKNIAVAL